MRLILYKIHRMPMFVITERGIPSSKFMKEISFLKPAHLVDEVWLNPANSHEFPKEVVLVPISANSRSITAALKSRLSNLTDEIEERIEERNAELIRIDNEIFERQKILAGLKENIAVEEDMGGQQ